MKWLNCEKFWSLLVVVAIVLGGSRNSNADFTFGEPTNLGPIVNSSSSEWPPSISADGLSLYFCSNRPGGYGGRDLWVTTRPTKDDEWDAPLNLGPTVNSSAKEAFASISADGLSLFFESTRTGGYGGHDLWVTTRATINDDWSAPVNLGPTVNSSSNDATPNISTDGLSLFFESDRSGGYGGFDIWITTRETTGADWSAPTNLGSTVNLWSWDGGPITSADGLALFFFSNQIGGYGSNDIWVTTRKTILDDWGTPVNPGPTINTSTYEEPGSISTDGLLLYFESDRPGGLGSDDLWQVSIKPIVDLNSDGIVNAADMSIMVDYWGTDNSICDIGPMPWGDGIVDVQDLVVLAEHLFEEPGLIAYWMLDEIEGDIAYDSSGSYDGILMGSPVWQPDAGIVAGALQFDGIDDYIITDYVLDPADGPFSVFAWIQGGAPGQVIISQADGIGTGETWLGITASDGNLMTGLMPYQVGRTVIFPLESQSLITDGQWHHVGFVWDGSYRSLYVDGTEVAKDTNPITLSPLIFANGGLYIGAGKTLDAASLFSGLIDDVRIYDVALSAEQIAALAQ